MKKIKGIAWLLVFVLLSIGAACAQENPTIYIGTRELGFTEYPLSLEGEQPLTLENLEKSWPIDQPYQWEPAQ